MSTRNARFQQWEALLANRAKRARAGEFIVQGVRPITMAIRAGWEVRELLFDADARLSEWARSTLDAVPATRVAVSRELMGELGDREEPPELLAVVGLPADDLTRIPTGPGMLVVILDRPASPGNIGTLLRSADAFGATGVIIAGHAADAYDPKAVRASTGSIFSVPVVRMQSPRPVLDWISRLHSGGIRATLTGTDENGTVDVADADLSGPTAVLVGNETTGLSAAWRESCDQLVRIPMAGTATSLNAATAGSIVLYEAARQRAVRTG